VRYYFRIFNQRHDVTAFANKYNDDGSLRFATHSDGIAAAEADARAQWAALYN
jgi:hypothetical protein